MLKQVWVDVSAELPPDRWIGRIKVRFPVEGVLEKDCLGFQRRDPITGAENDFTYQHGTFDGKQVNGLLLPVLALAVGLLRRFCFYRDQVRRRRDPDASSRRLRSAGAEPTDQKLGRSAVQECPEFSLIVQASIGFPSI